MKKNVVKSVVEIEQENVDRTDVVVDSRVRKRRRRRTFQPPFVQRARDTRKVRFVCFLSFFFSVLYESLVCVRFRKKKTLLRSRSEGCCHLFSSCTFYNEHIFKLHTFCDMYTHTHIFLFPSADSRAGRACMGRMA